MLKNYCFGGKIKVIAGGNIVFPFFGKLQRSKVKMYEKQFQRPFKGLKNSQRLEKKTQIVKNMAFQTNSGDFRIAF